MRQILFLLFLALHLNSESLEKVSFQVTWYPSFAFAGVYTAYEKGFYKDKGLDLQIKAYDRGTGLFSDIQSAKTTYSMVTSDLTLHQYEGEEVTLLASYLKRNILVFLTKPNIKTVEDLKEKTIISSDVLYKTSLFVLMKQHGLEKNDIKLFKRDKESYIDDFINNEEVGAITVFLTNQVYEMKKRGIEFNIINPAEYGIYSYGLNLFTSDEELKNNRQRTLDFVEATKKGWKYAFSNKEEIIELIANKYKSNKTKDALLYEAKELEKLFQTNLYEIGEILPQLEEVNLKQYKLLGLIDKDWEGKNSTSIKESNNFIYNLSWIVFISLLIVLAFYYRAYLLKQKTKALQYRLKEQKDLLLKQNKMASMGEMIDCIAHQWRQPLHQINSVIMGIDTEINSKKINIEHIENKLLEIENFTSYMSNTIEDFRNFVLKEKEKEQFSLSDCINESLKIQKSSINSSFIDINLSLDKKIVLEGYKSEFQQIFLILLNNSKDAFEINSIKNRVVNISSKIEDEVIITIEDNAGGVDEAELSNIFKAYYTLKEDGTGLGLHICKLIVEDSMNGSIKAKNTKEGLKFFIKIPKTKNNK